MPRPSSWLLPCLFGLRPEQPPCYRRNVIRGALTAGDAWIFLILVVDPDGNGATYWQSEIICILSGMPLVVTSPRPDAITGLLARWVGLSPVIGFASAMALLTCSHGTR